MMDMSYDENISENKFFRDFVNQHSYVFKRVIREGWILCVPRSGSFLKSVLLESDVAEHILIPSPDSPTTRFRTLSGKDVTLVDRTLTIVYSISKSCSSYLLFEETFYNDDDNNDDKVKVDNGNENDTGKTNDNRSSNLQEPHKYRVWCLERPLLDLEIAEIQRHDVTIVTNLREAMGLLWTEAPDKNAFKDLEIVVKEFERVNKNFEVEPLHVQRELVGAVYTACIQRLTKNTRYEDKSSNNEHYCYAIKISVETYVLYSLRNILRNSVTNHTAIQDADLNRTIKSHDELELSELGIRVDLQDGISRGRLELSRLDHFATVLGKAGCIKRAIHYVSPRGASPLSSDDLLSILVSLVLRTGLSNWTAQLIFMKLFRFSTNIIHKADEIEFLITSLEAAIEHIKSGALLRDSSHIKMQEAVSLEHTLKQIKGRTASKVEPLFSTNKRHHFNGKSTDGTLCHPLCTCESCEKKSSSEKESLCWPVTGGDTTRDDKERTILHLAARYGRTSIVEYLLNNGDIDVNVSDADGLTPLHYASSRGYQKIMLLLLHANADSRKVDTRYNTPLHFAVDYGHENCVKTLLYFAEQAKIPFDISPANANGDTPLHYASKWGYIDIVQILLERGANREAVNKRGQTPLTVAHSKHIHSLFGLVRTYDESYRLNTAVKTTTTIRTQSNPTSSSELQTCLSLSKDEYANRLKLVKNSPKYTVSRQHLIDRLSIAIAQGDVRLACYYIGFDTCVRSTEASEARTRDLCHPLCICERCAAITENFSEKRKKISVWAINARNTVGETALHVASASNCVEIVRLLLDAGANVNATTKTEQRTPLHLACLSDSVNVARLLLNCATCDIDAKDLNGDTPLHLAIRLGNTQLIKLLVRHDVNIKLRNSLGVTPLQEMEKKVSEEEKEEEEEEKEDDDDEAFPSTLSNLLALFKSTVTQN